MTQNVNAANSMATPLNFHVDDLPDNQSPGYRHACRQVKKLDADRSSPQDTHGLRIDQIQGDSKRDRKNGQDPAGKPPLRGVHTHLPLQTESLADHIRGLFEHLGEVTSALLLNENGCHDDPEVLEGNAIDHVIHRGPQFKAVVLLIETNSEFPADRFG